MLFRSSTWQTATGIVRGGSRGGKDDTKAQAAMIATARWPGVVLAGERRTAKGREEHWTDGEIDAALIAAWAFDARAAGRARGAAA